MHVDIPQLIQGIKDNDDKILNYIFKKYGPKVIGYVIKNSGSEEDGQEILQETILKVWKNIRDGKYDDRGKFDSYFYRIAANSWRETLRWRKSKGTSSLSEKEYELSDRSYEDQDIAFVNNQKNIALRQGLTRLGHICQELIKAFHFQEIPLKDLAEKHAMEYGTLRKRIYDCRTRLKKFVEEELKMLLS